MESRANLLQWLDQITPRCCRILARDVQHKGQALTVNELSKRSGLTPRRITWLSLQDSWEKITVGEMVKFQEACGVHRWNRGHQMKYFRRSIAGRRPLTHLNSPSYGREFRKKLLGLP